MNVYVIIVQMIEMTGSKRRKKCTITVMIMTIYPKGFF